MRKALLLFGTLALISCSTTPPDVPVCIETDVREGWCTNTISDKEFFVNDTQKYDFNGKGPQDWWSQRPTLVMLPASSWAAIKAYIIKTCAVTKMCDSSITSWEKKVNDIDTKLADVTGDPAPTPVPTASANTGYQTTMQYDSIKWIQKKLKVTVTGNYNVETTNAIHAFQKKVGLPVTGIPDAAFMDALNKE